MIGWDDLGEDICKLFIGRKMVLRNETFQNLLPSKITLDIYIFSFVGEA